MIESHRDRKFLNLFKELNCSRCGLDDGTIVAAHINGQRAYSLGRGISKKPSDYACAALCHTCHSQLDGQRTISPDEHSELFLMLIVLTHIQLIERGLMQIA